MNPAFTKALYYPYIDIENSDWLKTAVLFWDAMYTIVPESFDHPYKSYDSEYLYDTGFLQSIYVNSESEAVVGIEDEIISLLYSPEYTASLSLSKNRKINRIFDGKMSYRLREELEHMLRPGIYPEKMSERTRRILSHFYRNGAFYLDSAFSYAYMLTLANKICENRSIGLVTDDASVANVINPIRFGKQTSLFDYRYGYSHGMRQYEQGVLLESVIDGLRISPETTLQDIISFKDRHKDELGLFRTQLANLTKEIPADITINALREEMNNLYVNEFSPAYNNFKSALKGSGIKWFVDNLLKVSGFSVSATAFPALALGLTIPQALFAGIGVSIVASSVSYCIDKKQKLRENPYSYLLATENEL